MNKKISLISIVAAFFTFNSYSQDFLSYDEIVKSLDQSRVSTQAPRRSDPFESLRMHASLGMVGSYITIATPKGKTKSGIMNGFDATFGIDLFDPAWVTEFGIRSFNESRLNDKLTRLSLREFDLKVVYQPEIFRSVRLRVGGGLAARYLTFENSVSDSGKERYTTPASILKTGFIAKLTDVISLGVDITYRNRLIGDTIDQSALDSTIRADFNF